MTVRRDLSATDPSTPALTTEHHGTVVPAEQPTDPGHTRPQTGRERAPEADSEVDTAATVREQVALTDGTTVLVRSVESSDADALAAGYQRLSATSAYRRFFTTYPSLSPQQVRYFTAVDHHDHEALGAVTAEDGEGIGIARYIREPHDPSCAELAIVVLDDWQRVGVGHQLMRVLCDRARDEGISTLHAETLADNPALPALLRRFGVVDTRTSGTATLATLSLHEDGQPDNPG